VTCHRRENWKFIDKLCNYLKQLQTQHINEHIIFFCHPNPIVKNIVHNVLQDTPCTIYDNVPHLQFLKYIQNAKIITDSGGIQEEASFLGIPTLVYRNVTERPEGINDGPLKLVGNDITLLSTEINMLLTDTKYYNSRCKKVLCYGEGDTAIKIVDLLESKYT